MGIFDRVREFIGGLRNYDYAPPKIRPERIGEPRSIVVFPAESRKWEGLVWHHSYSKDNPNSDEWLGIIRYHTSYRIDGNIVTKEEFDSRLANKNGKKFEGPWSDVGYHGGVERANSGGLVWRQGRPWTRSGAHAGHPGNNSFNDKYLGLCCIGNFDAAVPDKETWEFCLQATREIMKAFRIPKDKVLGHRETYALVGLPQGKTCPGTQWSMEDFRGAL
jgi:hypothetical protein